MYKYLLAVLVSVVLVGLVGQAQAEGTTNYWGNNSTPVSNYWHNDSNWAHGIPDSTQCARIRSNRDVEEHVTVQTGNTAETSWFTIGGWGLDEGGSYARRYAAIRYRSDW